VPLPERFTEAVDVRKEHSWTAVVRALKVFRHTALHLGRNHDRTEGQRAGPASATIVGIEKRPQGLLSRSRDRARTEWKIVDPANLPCRRDRPCDEEALLSDHANIGKRGTDEEGAGVSVRLLERGLNADPSGLLIPRHVIGTGSAVTVGNSGMPVTSNARRAPLGSRSEPDRLTREPQPSHRVRGDIDESGGNAVVLEQGEQMQICGRPTELSAHTPCASFCEDRPFAGTHLRLDR
jgi:hypothetical protein